MLEIYDINKQQPWTRLLELWIVACPKILEAIYGLHIHNDTTRWIAKGIHKVKYDMNIILTARVLERMVRYYRLAWDTPAG